MTKFHIINIFRLYEEILGIFIKIYKQYDIYKQYVW